MSRPARGDRKPCTEAGCQGTMQFGRRLGNQAVAAPSEQAWTCDASTHRDSLSRASAAGSSVPTIPPPGS